MFLRHGAHFFFGLAVVLFITAGVCYYYETDEHGAFVEDGEREFPSFTVGTHDVPMKLHNPTRHKIRVVGYGTC